MILPRLYGTSMIAILAVLVVGCKSQSGLDQLSAKIEGAKAIRSKFTVMRGGNQETGEILFSKPNRLSTQIGPMVVTVNETEGYFEMDTDRKLFDLVAWRGSFQPGTGRVVSKVAVESGPFFGINPKKIPSTPWKLSKTENGVEIWTAIVKTRDESFPVELGVSRDGELKFYVSPQQMKFTATSMEFLPEQSKELFTHKIPDGIERVGEPLEGPFLEVGNSLDWSKLERSAKYKGWKPKGATLFVLCDSPDAPNADVQKWMKTPLSKIEKVPVLLGAAKGREGFFDVTGNVTQHWTSTLPTFFLVEADGRIIGIWLGWDKDKVAQFERDISLTFREES